MNQISKDTDLHAARGKKLVESDSNSGELDGLLLKTSASTSINKPPTRRETLQTLRPPPMKLFINRLKSLDEKGMSESGKKLLHLKKIGVDKITENDEAEKNPTPTINSAVRSEEGTPNMKPVRNRYVMLICVIGKLIRRFVKLRKKLASNRIENLTSFHHSIINDKSADYDKKKVVKALNWKNMIGNGLSYLNITVMLFFC